MSFRWLFRDKHKTKKIGDSKDDGTDQQSLLSKKKSERFLNRHSKTKGKHPVGGFSQVLTIDTSVTADDYGGRGSDVMRSEEGYASDSNESVSSYQQKLKKYGCDSPQNTAKCLNNLGYLYQQNAMNSPSNSSVSSYGSTNSSSFLNKNKNASPKSNATVAYKASLRLKKKEYGNSHPSVATTMNNLASVYFSHGHYSAALKYYEKALKIMTKHLGIDHLNCATVYNNIGDVHYAKQNDKISMKCYKEALRIRRITLQESDIRVIRLIDKMELIRWRKLVADSHMIDQKEEQDGEVSALKQEITADMDELDDLECDMMFHVELISRKRRRSGDNGKRQSVKKFKLSPKSRSLFTDSC